ncbi:MAG: ribose 5-phosphate isomerase B [Bacteroidales bacterium]|nr:ribose 5-phosphate isomerase B [Bacteroidales bacterium]
METIAIGSDHAAFEFKEEIKKYLESKGYGIRDFGTYSPERTDYPDYAFKVGEAVSAGEYEKGMLFCGTGIGMSISANKVKGIRAVVCSEPFSAKMARAHNNSNVLCLGARVVGIELAEMIIDTWLNTKFEGGRHQERVEKITKYDCGR